MADSPLPSTEDLGVRSTATGPLARRSITVVFKPDVSDAVQLYVTARVGTEWFALTESGWVPRNGEDFPSYSGQVSTPATIQVAEAMDLTPFRGGEVYAGYGESSSEMLTNSRYALVHTLD